MYVLCRRYDFVCGYCRPVMFRYTSRIERGQWRLKDLIWGVGVIESELILRFSFIAILDYYNALATIHFGGGGRMNPQNLPPKYAFERGDRMGTYYVIVIRRCLFCFISYVFSVRYLWFFFFFVHTYKAVLVYINTICFIV